MFDVSVLLASLLTASHALKGNFLTAPKAPSPKILVVLLLLETSGMDRCMGPGLVIKIELWKLCCCEVIPHHEIICNDRTSTVKSHRPTNLVTDNSCSQRWTAIIMHFLVWGPTFLELQELIHGESGTQGAWLRMKRITFWRQEIFHDCIPHIQCAHW